MSETVTSEDVVNGIIAKFKEHATITPEQEAALRAEIKQDVDGHTQGITTKICDNYENNWLEKMQSLDALETQHMQM